MKITAKKALSFLACTLFIASAFAAGKDITGSYECKGFDPFKKVDYKGQAKIVQGSEPNIYHFSWHFEDNVDCTGTGMQDEKNRNITAVSFSCPSQPQYTGVQSYYLKADGSLQGHWVLQGENQMGSETCKKVG